MPRDTEIRKISIKYHEDNILDVAFFGDEAGKQIFFTTTSSDKTNKKKCQGHWQHAKL